MSWSEKLSLPSWGQSPQTIIRGSLSTNPAGQVENLMNFSLPTRKQLVAFFLEMEGSQTRYAKHLSPLWGEDELDIKLRNLAKRLSNKKLGVRLPESMAEYVSVLGITDASIFGIIIALRWEGTTSKPSETARLMPSIARLPRRKQHTQESMWVENDWKEHFISTLSNIAWVQGQIIHTITSRRNIRNKIVDHSYQKRWLQRNLLTDFWSTLLTDTNIETLKKEWYSLDTWTHFTLTRESSGWTHVFHLPVGVNIGESREAKNSDTKNNKPVFESTEKLQDHLKNIAQAKKEFREILEWKMKTIPQEERQKNRGVRKPRDFHLILDWDVWFDQKIDLEKKTISLSYRAWYPRDLNYAKDLLGIMNPLYLDPVWVTGEGEKRVLTYTVSTGWNISLILA